MLRRALPRAWLLAVLLMLLVVGSAHAQTQIAGRRVALVIGNAGYITVPRLPNAGNDARLMATTLRGLGFSLVGGGAQLDLDRQHMAEMVEAFGRALNGADVALFYYSGHGLQVQGVNWLVPVDASPSRPKDLDFQMLDADLVLRQMDGSGTRLNIVLLDACRNNPFSVAGLRSVQGGLAEMRAAEGTLISYATQPGNVAVDGAGANSPYTSALASAMRQPGTDIFRMFNQVGLEVKRNTAGSQQPWVSTSPIDGDFFFAGPAAVPAHSEPEALGTSAPGSTAPGTLALTAAPIAGSGSALPDAGPQATPPMPSAPLASAAGLGGRTKTASLAVPPPETGAPQGSGPLAPVPGPMLDPAGSQPSREPGAHPMPLANVADVTRALADVQRCSVLDAKSSANGHVEIRGVVALGPLWTEFTRQIGQTRGAILVMSDIDVLPPFACDILSVLQPSVRATRDQIGGRMILPLRSAVRYGGTMTVTLSGVVGDVIALDVFRSDATVEHLVLAPPLRRSGDIQVPVAGLLKSVPGHQLLVAIAGLLPGTLGSRPTVERTGFYLQALRQALETNVTAQVDAVPLVVQAAVLPAAISPPTQAALAPHTSRCAGIIERAQLGEPLPDSDRAVLRSCH